jgi:hypothetical protein
MTRVRCVLAVVIVLAAAPPVRAQAPNVGAGPLTQSLPDTEPTVGILTIGPVRLAPGLVIRQIGWDDNIFDERDNPKEDFVATIAPDVAAFTRLRFVQLSGYAGVDFNYFKTYEQERSTGHNLRGRADILLSRLRPFVGGGQVNSRERPNGEIDVRADRDENELSGGVAFDISRYGVIYGAAYQYQTRFTNAFEEGVDLGVALNRDRYLYSGGLRTELTPLLAMNVSASYSEDLFEEDPTRNAESWAGTVEFRFDPDAVVSGQATLGYLDFVPVNPAIEPYRGFIGSGSIVYPFIEIGRFAVQGLRRTEFSFDTDDAYFVESTLTLSYTHFLFGEVDVQVKGSKSWFDYGFTATSPARQDKYDAAGGSLGYNLRNRTRISMNYEYARRRSLELPERNYDRRRWFLAWTFAY